MICCSSILRMPKRYACLPTGGGRGLIYFSVAVSQWPCQVLTRQCPRLVGALLMPCAGCVTMHFDERLEVLQVALHVAVHEAEDIPDRLKNSLGAYSRVRVRRVWLSLSW